MKITNFVYTDTLHKSGELPTHFATIDVTTGYWFWKQTKTREICKQGSFWFFTDTGEHTPGYMVEQLERAALARKAKEYLPR